MTLEELAKVATWHEDLAQRTSPLYSVQSHHTTAAATIRAAMARIAALKAERDAAVAALQGVRNRLDGMIAEQVAEGERRATAAIVAFLKSLPSHRANRSTIAQIEAGDHLPSAVNAL